MSALKVGQRVRVNFPPSKRHGEEAVVESELMVGEYGGKVVWYHRVSFNGCHLDPNSGLPNGYEPHELEPIIPEGHQVISWESMKDLWQPQGEVA